MLELSAAGLAPTRMATLYQCAPYADWLSVSPEKRATRSLLYLLAVIVTVGVEAAGVEPALNGSLYTVAQTCAITLRPHVPSFPAVTVTNL